MVQPSSTPVTLLVDGYNVLGTWHNCGRRFPSLEEGRRQLVEALVNYSALRGYQTRVVFDAHYQSSEASEEIITAQVSVYYTDYGQTADTYIEKSCAILKTQIQRRLQRLIVATSDRAQSLVVAGYGAEWISAVRLMQELKGISQVLRRQQPATRLSAGRFLAHSLDPVAQAKLARLRHGLEP